MFGVFVIEIAYLRMSTVLNALLVSKTIATVHFEGFGLLKPFVIV